MGKPSKPYYSMKLHYLTGQNVDKWFELYDKAEPKLIKDLSKAVEKLENAKDLVKRRKAALRKQWYDKKARGKTKLTVAGIDAEVDLDEQLTELRDDRARLEGKVKELQDIMWSLQRKHDRAKMFKDHELRMERRDYE